MLRMTEVKERVESQVPGLQLRNAGEFAQLVEKQQMPQWGKGGFILPGRLQGGGVKAIAGAFVQDLDEGVSIVLVTRHQGDPTGAIALDELTPLIRAVVNALCGYGPADAPGVYVLSGGELVGSQGGALIYQLDFALSDQLRIFS